MISSNGHFKSLNVGQEEEDVEKGIGQGQEEVWRIMCWG